MHTIIRTLPDLQQAQANAWVYGLAIALIAVGVAFLLASLIPWRSDRRDYITRRISFIVIGLVAPFGYWLYNMQTVVPRITNAGFRNMFEATNLYILIAALVVYFGVGMLLMACFRTSKFGSILGKKK